MGRHSSGRAELNAMVNAAKMLPHSGVIVTDCQAVAKGICKLTEWKVLPPWLLRTRSGDLWSLAQAAAVNKDITIVWIASHLSQDEALASGFLRQHWEGNGQVDKFVTRIMATQAPDEARWQSQEAD